MVSERETKSEYYSNWLDLGNMESHVEVIGGNKSVILDMKRYGYWKVRMAQLIRAQGEDAWNAIEDGWEAPYGITNENHKIPKPKIRWTRKKRIYQNTMLVH